MTDEPDLLVAGRYRLVRRLGRSDEGVAWEAADEAAGGSVVLQMLATPTAPTEDHGLVLGRALHEAREAIRFEHPNAVRVLDVLQHGGEPCLVVELVAAPTLAERVREQGTLSPEEAARLGGQVASALAAARVAGVVHDDITSERILVDGDVDGDGTARLAGFGIAPRGTPTEAADVQALGTILYAAVEGAPPAVPTAPHHAEALGPLLLEMLDPDPTARPSMGSVADRLGRVAAGEPDRPPSPPVAAPTGRASRARLWAVVAVVVVVLLAVATLALLRMRGSEPAAAPRIPPVPSTETASLATTSVPSSPSGSSSPDAGRLAAVVTRFYSFVPSDADSAFDLLTTDYQTRVAGGRQAFLRFWSQYSTVSASDVTATPPSTVTATVTYTTRAGQVTRERTTFGLVDAAGVLKIGSTTVTGRS